MSNLKHVLPSDSRNAIYVNDSMIHDVLNRSHGETTMSDQDVKVAIVCLLGMAKTQGNIIERLIQEIEDIKTPKKFWQFWK